MHTKTRLKASRLKAPGVKARVVQSLIPYFPALVSGVLLTAAFPDTGCFILAFGALVPLLISIGSMGRKPAFYAGMVTGTTHYLGLIYWIVPTLSTYGGLHPVLAVSCLVLLALYLALYTGVFAFLLCALGPRPWLAPLWGGLIWISLEFIRTHALTGFPWGVLGYSQYTNTWLVQSADFFGVLGISFVLVVFNGLLVYAWGQIRALRNAEHHPAGDGRACPAGDQKHPAMNRLGLCSGTMVLILTFFLAYGKFRLQTVDQWIREAPKADVAIIQGNIPQDQKWDTAFKDQTVARYSRLSLIHENPDLVVWPETALPFYYGRNVTYSNQVDDLVRRAKSHFLIGSPAADTHGQAVRYFNRAYMLNPLGLVTGVYDKSHLVPFGEYVPFQDQLWFIQKLVAEAGNFTAGQGGGTPLEFGDHKTGVLICFEILFPGLSRKFTANGADILTTITNDAWFGTTSAPAQHFSVAVLRAVENRRAVVRAANTGISGFIDPGGRILDHTGLFEARALARQVPALTRVSVYTRFGDPWPIAAMVAICLGFMIKPMQNRQL